MWIFSYDFWGNSNFGGWVESVALPGLLIVAVQHVHHRRQMRHLNHMREHLGIPHPDEEAP